MHSTTHALTILSDIILCSIFYVISSGTWIHYVNDDVHVQSCGHTPHELVVSSAGTKQQAY